MNKFWLVAGLLLVFVACSQPPTANEVATAVPTTTTVSPSVLATAVPNHLYVNSAISQGPINPLVYGSNYGPWAGLPANGLEYYQNSHITFLRFPGGNWGDENDLRPFHIDSFMDIVGMIDAEPLIHVNLLRGTPEEAVELLRYTNEEKGYGVKYWSIGNEPTLYNNKPSVTPGEWDAPYYNARWREFAEAMKAQDPSILLVGPDVHQFTAVDANNPKDSQGLDFMREFLRANGDLVDIVSMHRYPFPTDRQNPNPSIDDLRQNSPEWDQIIPFLRQMIQEETGRDLPIAVTEVNSNWSNTLGGEATPDSFYNAIWWADALGRMINQNVDIVNHWMLYHPRDGTGILDRSEPRPTYYVYQMYDHFGNEKLHADSGVADVSIFAAQRDDGAVTLMMVNRGPDEVTVPLQVDGYEGSSAELWRFDAEHKAENLGAIEWANGETITLPGQSISLLILQRTEE
jgi:alpha-L-arabinofuranosidase